MIEVNEQEIRDLVYSRKHDLNVSESLSTPKFYKIRLKNEYLNVAKLVKKPTLKEIEDEIKLVLTDWNEQEIYNRLISLQARKSKYDKLGEDLVQTYRSIDNILSEAEIRQIVFDPKYDLTIKENWHTPSGNVRSNSVYEVFLLNDYLSKSKRIKKPSVHEVELEMEKVLRSWIGLEIKEKGKGKSLRLYERVKEELDYKIRVLKNILNDTIHFDDKLNWNLLKEKIDIPEYQEEIPFPTLPELPSKPEKKEFELPPKPVKTELPQKPIEPERSFFDFIAGKTWKMKEKQYEDSLKFWENKVSQLESSYENEFQKWESTNKTIIEASENNFKNEVTKWELAVEKNKEERERLKKNWENDVKKEKDKWVKKSEDIKEKNESVEAFFDGLKEGYELKKEASIKDYFQTVFKQSRYPDFLNIAYNVEVDGAGNLLVVDLSLPRFEAIPEVKEYKFKKTTNEIIKVKLKENERKELYDNVINQLVVRTAHEVFESDYKGFIQQCVINGWLTHLNASLGKEETSCLISVSFNRDKFDDVNLEMIEPAQTIKLFKGVVASTFSDIAPVQPIMKLDKNDRRFVESQEVLANLNSTTNLASIDWEEFEHLVRELFASMFSEGDSEVKVTQASSDGGIDAIAFDPDPIRGGKFVIQAKRYTKVVPVSAVRDLYGTMISEGASKGILVTTAHFGNDSRDFIKNKPISLIDGSNLVYLLEQYGYKVRIDIKEARKEMGLRN